MGGDMSLDQIQRETFAPFTALQIERKTKMWRMPGEMKRGFPKLSEVAKSQGLELAEMPYCMYLGLDAVKLTNQGVIAGIFGIFTKMWHYQMGFPVKGEAKDEGEVKVFHSPELQVITGVHTGPYAKVGDSYKEIYQWILNRDLAPADYCYEIYQNDPAVTPQEELTTKLVIPFQG